MTQPTITQEIGPILKQQRKRICGVDRMSKETGLAKTQIIAIESGLKNYTIASLDRYTSYIGLKIKITI